ncbi:MAG: hypothetical protein II942_05305 [Alphaproteobacteria bacterium]|nr:hypothetical protein [Alphaproteobacteria bacterium]
MAKKFLPHMRSGLRALLASASVAFGGFKVAAAATQPDAPEQDTASLQQTLIPQNSAMQAGRDFFQLAYPLLKRNEGLRLDAYLDSVHKVTIGIGCNIQDAPEVAKEMVRKGEITFYHKKRKMTSAQFDAFIKTIKTKTKAQLAEYTMNEADAIKLSRETFAAMYQRVTERFAKPDGKLPGIDFEQLPVFLKIAVMDTIYNVGETRFFNTFPKCNKALREGNYSMAFVQLRLSNAPASRAFRKDALAVCYAVQMMYQKDCEKYGTQNVHPHDSIFYLSGFLRSLSEKDTYKPKAGKNKGKQVINAWERARFFDDVADVWATILYPQDSHLQHTLRIQELKDTWNSMERIHNRVAAERKAKETSCSVRPKRGQGLSK